MSLLQNVVQNEAVHFRGITKSDAIIYNSPRSMLIGTNLSLYHLPTQMFSSGGRMKPSNLF